MAADNGIVVGFTHYEVSADGESGRIGLNAVHPAQQRKGIGTMMYKHVFDLMRTAGMRARANGDRGDPSHILARV